MKKLSCILLILILNSNFVNQVLSQEKTPVDYVNVFTGTSNSRWMLFPGPAMPFGMVKLSPDNQSNVWNGGYEYTVASISGFSHIHSWSMSGLSIMPTTGNIKTFPGPSDGPFKHMWTAGYRSRFYKEEEKASVGYYRVNLYDYDILTELTATNRCGFLRFTYPETDKANLIFNFNFEYEENNPSINEAFVRKVSETEIEGYVKKHSSFADDYTVHFIARFSKPIKSFKTWERQPFEGYNLYGTEWRRETTFYENTEKTLHNDCGAAISFATTENEQIDVQTAISLVSIEQARLNFKTEMEPFGGDFNAVVDNSKSEWNKLLGKINVESTNEKDIERFYTNMYRAYVARTNWNDVNGKYVDMCENVQQLPSSVRNIYGSDALWGAHWNLFPLWTLVTPDIANEWVNSLIEMYDKGGWLPQGPEGIEYCEVMVAAHQIKLIISAYQKGIRNFDVEKAYEAIYKNQTVPGMEHPCGGWAGNKNLESFQEYGYVANEDGPVSNTLEIAFDDWALAQLAKALGKKKDYRYFTKQSKNYENIFDPQTRFMRQRHADGSWVQDWDSLENHGTWYGAGYVEGTAWHYSFFVPHDLPELAQLVGRKRFIRRLEQGFENGYIDIGNQPNMQAPFVFNHVGAPWLTQKYVRYVLDQQFDSSPLQGWPGEEDQGQLGAWYVLASMGLFQMKGGCDVESHYDLTTPLYDKVTIQLDDQYYSGKKLIIETKNNDPGNIYIQSASFNGEPLQEAQISHETISKGGRLVFKLGNTPNENWGKYNRK
jgi:predicted alpha-1,2-mannosidase